MRVRFYEVGDGTVGFVLRCDSFPVVLGVDPPTGRLTPKVRTENPVCRLEDAGGQILFEGLDEQHPVLVNDAPLACGPLHPGDHLSLDGHRYVVSYEQTTTADPLDARYRLMTV
jgi:hypothetical protein